MIEKEFRNEDPSGKTAALMLLIVCLMGGGTPAVKLGLQGFPPLIMAFFQCILGLVVVGGLGFYFGMSMRLRFEEVPRLLVLAALYILRTITLNVGTQLTIASRATIFFTLYPLFTVIFGHFYLPDQRLSVRKILGILVAFGGVFIAVAPDFQDGGKTFIGDLIVILAACFIAFRITLAKVFVQDIYPHRLFAWMLGLSMPCFLGLSYLFERGQPVKWTLASSVGLIYQGWIFTGFCLLGLLWLLRTYKVNKLVVFSFLMPISGLLFSHLFLGDEMTPSILMGAGLVAAGIYIVNGEP